MEFDFRKLKGRIIERYGTVNSFSKVVGIKSSSISQKLNNNVKFTTEEIIIITKALQIPAEEIYLYFFTIKV